MPARKHYSNAPIQEAVIYVQTVSSTFSNMSRLESCAKKLRETLPLHQKLTETSVGVAVNAGQSTNMHANTSFVGYRLETVEDPKKVLQIKPDSFTFSWLRPYETWEAFCGMAKDYWAVFFESMRPDSISRLGVRYIDRLNLPADEKGLVDHEKYLTVYPHLPPQAGLTQMVIANAVMQVQMPQPDINAMLVHNQASAPPVEANSISLILDTDIFSDAGWPVDAAAWEFIDCLHDRHNDAFECFITDLTRELIR